MKLRWILVSILLVLGAITTYATVWYHRFYHHITPQEVSHEVKHSTFQGTIRAGSPVTLQLYQQANAANQRLVFFTSGDGGWSPFCADVAAHIAATGKTVVGFDVKDYLVNFASSQKPISADELGQDYAAIVMASRAQSGVDPQSGVVIAGWSLGAGYSVLAASEPELKNKVDRVIAISLPTYNELAWKPTDALIYITHGTPREKVFDAHQYLRRLELVPLVMVNATGDETSPLKEARSLFAAVNGPRHFYSVNSSGHHFEGGETEFYRDLDEGLSLAVTRDSSDHQ